ncbi:MAG: GNAT family N-acetyltransferase [Pseudomonadota bacterium]
MEAGAGAAAGAGVEVRAACAADTPAMAALLNQIIAIGGTTALQTPVTADWFVERLAVPRSCWHVAVAEDLLGFQWAAPNPKLPPDIADIATFVRVGLTGRGVGSALFRATETCVRARGYGAINATIRGDNTGGLAYYSGRGFRDHDVTPAVPLADGTPVDRVHKRFALAPAR